MDSLKRKCFDCKHCIDAVVADTLDGWVIESKFGFYHRSAVVSAAHRSIGSRSIDLTDSIPDADKLAHCVICRNRLAAVAAAAVVVEPVGLVADFEIYLALCGRLVEREDPRSSVGDLKHN
jgi:hypothetical protein